MIIAMNTPHFGSLVQRELSAKLTEGLFYYLVYTGANAREIIPYH